MSVASHRDVHVRADPPHQCIEALLRAPVSAQEAWSAIAEPPQLRRWFGTLSSEFSAGGTTRIDFGDGDFLAVSVNRVAPPVQLQYTSRFLGIAPEALITWTITPCNEFDCEIHMRDEEPERSRGESDWLATRWDELLGRLARFLETGAWSRSSWRDDVNASIELPIPIADARALFGRAAQTWWLPVDCAGLYPAASFTLEGGSELEVRGVERVDADTIRLALGHADWPETTACVLGLCARSQGTLLEVHHSGFRGLPIDARSCKRLRMHVVETWIATLERATSRARLGA